MVVFAAFLHQVPLSSFAQETSAAPKVAQTWRPLTDDETAKWETVRFGGEGTVEMADGVISLGFGDPLTGVRWTGEFPKDQFEIELEARRVGGFDFFCGLTFPVGEGSCSLILGGWGGSLVGLSSIDGNDAANNDTMQIYPFEKERWYRVRVAVKPESIEAWLDDESLFVVEREGHQFEIRGEMEPSLPIGIAAFQTDSEVRNVRFRTLP